MKTIGSRLTYIIAPIVALVALGLSSCVSDRSSMREPTGVTVSADIAQSDLSLVKSLAVIDFYEGRLPGEEGGAYVDHITGFSFIPGQVATGSGQLVSNQFRFELSKRDITVSAQETTMEVVKKADPDLMLEYGVKLGVAVGKRLGVDFVVMGSVMRFEDLVGRKLAADKPASVSFSVAVIDVYKGKIAWKSKFEKTQTPLFSNILDYKTFFKGGMTWQKAHKLSAIGVESTLLKMKIGVMKR